MTLESLTKRSLFKWRRQIESTKGHGGDLDSGWQSYLILQRRKDAGKTLTEVEERHRSFLEWTYLYDH
jgi:hypothetical protein